MASTLRQIRGTAGAGAPLLWKLTVEAGSVVSVPVPVNAKKMEWSVGGNLLEGPIVTTCPDGATFVIAVYSPDPATVGYEITLDVEVDSFPVTPSVGSNIGTVVEDRFKRDTIKAPINTEAMRQAFFADADSESTERALDWLQAGNTLGDLLLSGPGGVSGALDPVQFSTVDGLITLNPGVNLAQFAEDEYPLRQDPSPAAVYFGYDDDGSGNLIPMMLNPGGGGAATLDVKTKAADYLVATDDQCLIATAALTFTLLTAVGVDKLYYFKNASVGNVILDGDASETIEGTTTITLAPGEAVILVSDQTNWKVM